MHGRIILGIIVLLIILHPIPNRFGKMIAHESTLKDYKPILHSIWIFFLQQNVQTQ